MLSHSSLSQLREVGGETSSGKQQGVEEQLSAVRKEHSSGTGQPQAESHLLDAAALTAAGCGGLRGSTGALQAAVGLCRARAGPEPSPRAGSPGGTAQHGAGRLLGSRTPSKFSSLATPRWSAPMSTLPSPLPVPPPILSTPNTLQQSYKLCPDSTAAAAAPRSEHHLPQP